MVALDPFNPVMPRELAIQERIISREKLGSGQIIVEEVAEKRLRLMPHIRFEIIAIVGLKRHRRRHRVNVVEV